ncbi:HlyD family type I secretion periplasmic adaptor subunit [Pseudooceanicola aestuarii]|uniref:HlyD family type I secretion periplasmic adaptor subunit n=1 Tax=Pseudooceanicola aestuarii TaxID=2697319 RepID=UPI0013D154B5|nr:HlyD family type I secretion periplasmic adaptor subunit [Pseudooceanicola aestuarii]
MLGNRIDEAFVNDVTRLGAARTGSAPWRLLLLVAGGLGAFLAWAALYEIEETTHGTGRVIPSRQVQVVQSLEGGIVSDIFVAEGDRVEAGAPLMQIDDTGFAAQAGELRETEAALLAEKARLEAEAAEAEVPTFPAGLTERAPHAVQAEQAVFFSRRDQYQRELAVLEQQRLQRESELAELRATREKWAAMLDPLRAELRLTEDLAARGVVPEIELLRLRTRVAEMEGDSNAAAATQARIQAAMDQATTEIAAARSAYRLTARQRLARLQVELAVAGQGLRAAADRVRRTLLRAPVRGTINTLNTTTTGAVVQPGAPLIDIVPADDGLLIEARIQPRDVAFIRPGERASVKITAYDYTIYGALEGEVLRIGSDAVEDREGRTYFKVVIRTETTSLGGGDGARGNVAALPIIPGMVASVDIQTGRKSVLTYLAKPILRARGEALRER